MSIEHAAQKGVPSALQARVKPRSAKVLSDDRTAETVSESPTVAPEDSLHEHLEASRDSLASAAADLEEDPLNPLDLDTSRDAELAASLSSELTKRPQRARVSTKSAYGHDCSAVGAYTQVPCVEFREQPYTVVVSTTALLLIDLHSHLTKTEIVGCLGGRYDENSKQLEVLEVHKICWSSFNAIHSTHGMMRLRVRPRRLRAKQWRTAPAIGLWTLRLTP
eukprot:m.325895 g.325895  ORF g.325895 m.325895 type:complete len:221 (+) comp55567_c0_seq2:1434-2096(+)